MNDIKWETYLLMILMPITMFLYLLTIIALLNNKKILKQQIFIFFLCITSISTCIGMIIGIPYNFEPSHYEGEPICVFQHFLAGGMMLCTSFLITCLMFTFYEILVLSKAKEIVNKKKNKLVLLSLTLGIFFQMIAPLFLPKIGDYYFDGVGAWCGPSSLLAITIFFYGVSIPPLTIAFYCAISIIRKVVNVKKQTKNLKVQAKGSNNNRIHKFYLRISIYALLFITSIFAGLYSRVKQLTTTDWYNPDREKDSSIGLSLILLVFLFFQSIIFLSIPYVVSFYSKLIYRNENSKSNASVLDTNHISNNTTITTTELKNQISVEIKSEN